MSLTTLLATVFVLGVVIVVHELGHFAMAKAVGIYVKTFSVGFGPKLLRRCLGETEYALSAVPFGGYVKMAGEGAMEEIQDAGTSSATPKDVTESGEPIPDHRLFSSKSPWQRLAVVVAGPAMNLVLALLVLISLVWLTGVPMVPVTTIGTVEENSPAAAAGIEVGDVLLEVEGQPVRYWERAIQRIGEVARENGGAVPLRLDRDGRIVEVTLQLPAEVSGERPPVGLWYQQDTRVGKVKKGGAADRAGLRRGDVILSIDGRPVESYGEVAEIINASIGKPLLIRWERSGVPMSATVVPEKAEVAVSFDEVKTIGRIYYEEYRENVEVGFSEALALGSRATWGMVEQTATFLKVLVTGGASRDAVSGPIRIGKVAGEMAHWGFDRLLIFLSLFSVNLFLLNLLPVPVLDGGHAVFIVYEMVTRRRANQRIQLVATQVGFVLLLLLMAFVITMDVIHVAG